MLNRDPDFLIKQQQMQWKIMDQYHKRINKAMPATQQPEKVQYKEKFINKVASIFSSKQNSNSDQVSFILIFVNFNTRVNINRFL